MPFDPRKYLTEEQINEIIDPVTLGVAGAAALAGGAAGYFLKKRGADKAAEQAAKDASAQAEKERESGLGQGRREGQREGFHQGRESVGRDQFLQQARDRAGLRSHVAQHYFADPQLIRDTHDHEKRFETGWHTVLSGSDDVVKGYVQNPHTFHAAVDKIKLDTDRRTNDAIAKGRAALAGGRTENYLTKGHDRLVKHIRDAARQGGAEGLDELTRTLVHHKHHGDADVMEMARTLLGHIGNRTDEIFAERTKGHEFNARTPVPYHPDLPHHTNSTGEAEILRHKILRDLFAGTYKPEERVIDTETSSGRYIDHPKYGKILDITSISRDRRAFEVDRAAVQRAEGRNIGELTPVQDLLGSPRLHGTSVGSPEGKEATRHITYAAQQRAVEKKKRDAWEAEQRKIAAGRQAEAQRKAAAEEAARQAPISPPAAPIIPPAAPVAPPQEGKGGRRGRPPKPKAEGGEAPPKKRGRGRPKKVNEDYLPPWFKVF
jgi:hypothetical protein